MRFPRAAILLAALLLTPLAFTSAQPALREDQGDATSEGVAQAYPDSMFQALPGSVASLDIQAFGDVPFAMRGYRVRALGDHAYVTTATGPDALLVFDISDPWHPTKVGSASLGPSAWARTYEALEVIAYADRTVVASSVTPGSDLTELAENFANFSSGPAIFWDVTDPSSPRELARIDVVTHMLVAHPETHMVYVAGFRAGAFMGIDIIDASDPDDIHHAMTAAVPPFAQDGSPVGDLAAFGCHGVSLDVAAERLYCAAGSQTLVLDITDPLDPVLVTTIRPLAVDAVFCCDHTYAVPFLGGRYVAISAEAGSCRQYPQGTQSPVGRLWLFDMQTSPPTLTGHVGVPSNRTAPLCTFSPTEGSELGQGTGLLAFGWEQAGLVLVDASDPTDPQIMSADFAGGFGRDAFYHRGLVFAAGERHALHVAVPIEGVGRPMADPCPNGSTLAQTVCWPW